MHKLKNYVNNIELIIYSRTKTLDILNKLPKIDNNFMFLVVFNQT